jgi:hypothetical protein
MFIVLNTESSFQEELALTLPEPTLIADLFTRYPINKSVLSSGQ